MTSPAALAAAIAASRCCCDIMALLAQYQNLATEVRRMHLADIAVRPDLGGGELDGHLLFWLDDFLNVEIFDLEAVRLIQLIDERELHFISLLYHQAGWQPDLGAVEEHVNQSELLGFSRCYVSSAKYQYGKKHNEPAELPAPPTSLSHGDFSFAATLAAACGVSAPAYMP